MSESKVRNSQFNPRLNFELGRPKWMLAIWYLIKIVTLQSAFPWPSAVKGKLLAVFGAVVGRGIYLKPRINVHIPWKLSIGSDTWIGEGVEIYNFAKVTIGSNCCISQRAFLCAANHDYRDPAMCYRHAPITIKDGAWIGACTFIAPGVTIGTDTVVTAGSLVTKDLPDGMVCSGNPCQPIKPRW
jgi:putative colanic acid biosynthesis acetyltransferase WcaF